SLQRVDRLLPNVPLRAYILDHPPGKAGFCGTERDRIQMAQDYVAVAEPERRGRDLTRDHFTGSIIEILIMRGAARVADDQAHTRAPSRAPTTLGVVVRPRRHVAQDDCIEAAN